MQRTARSAFEGRGEASIVSLVSHTSGTTELKHEAGAKALDGVFSLFEVCTSTASFSDRQKRVDSQRMIIETVLLLADAPFFFFLRPSSLF